MVSIDQNVYNFTIDFYEIMLKDISTTAFIVKHKMGYCINIHPNFVPIPRDFVLVLTLSTK